MTAPHPCPTHDCPGTLVRDDDDFDDMPGATCDTCFNFYLDEDEQAMAIDIERHTPEEHRDV